MKTLTQGTEIYYGGDMANDSGFGVIESVSESRWGINYKIVMEDARVMNISPSNFSEEYLGHGGTRFVTKAAYQAFRKAAIERMEREFAAMKARKCA